VIPSGGEDMRPHDPIPTSTYPNSLPTRRPTSSSPTISKADLLHGEDLQQQEEGNSILPALTEYPKLLDGALREQNTRSSLRAAILTPATTWEKSSSSSSSLNAVLTESDLQREKSAAFDLLDALTRSGGLVCGFSELHVLLGASHSFSESVMDSVGLDGMDPILRLERSQLVLAGALFGLHPTLLLPVGSHQLQRLMKMAPELFFLKEGGLVGNSNNTTTSEMVN